MNIDPHAYNITVRRGEFEGDVLYEARVKELPDLREYGDTLEEAYDLAIDAIETTARLFAEKGRAFPPPLAPAEGFSGRVTLRLPKTLHRALSEAAEDEGVSLNQHLVTLLSYFSGFSAGQSRERAPWHPVEKTPEIAGKKASRTRLKVIDCTNLQGDQDQAAWG